MSATARSVVVRAKYATASPVSSTTNANTIRSANARSRRLKCSTRRSISGQVQVEKAAVNPNRLTGCWRNRGGIADHRLSPLIFDVASFFWSVIARLTRGISEVDHVSLEVDQVLKR